MPAIRKGGNLLIDLCEKLDFSDMNTSKISEHFLEIDRVFLRFLQIHFPKLQSHKAYKRFIEGAKKDGWAKLDKHGMFMNWAHNPNTKWTSKTKIPKGKYYSFLYTLNSESTPEEMGKIKTNDPLLFSEYYASQSKVNPFINDPEMGEFAKLLNLPSLIFLAELSYKSPKEIAKQLESQPKLNNFNLINVIDNLSSYSLFEKHYNIDYVLPLCQNNCRYLLTLNFKTVKHVKSIFSIFLNRKDIPNTLVRCNELLLLNKHIDSIFSIGFFLSFEDYNGMDSSLIDQIRFQKEYYQTYIKNDLFNQSLPSIYKQKRTLSKQIESFLLSKLEIKSNSLLNSMSLQLTDFILQFKKNMPQYLNQSIYIYAFHKKFLDLYLEDRSFNHISEIKNIFQEFTNENKGPIAEAISLVLNKLKSPADFLSTLSELDEFYFKQLENFDNSLTIQIENYDDFKMLKSDHKKFIKKIRKKIELNGLRDTLKTEIPKFSTISQNDLDMCLDLIEQKEIRIEEVEQLIELLITIFSEKVFEVIESGGLKEKLRIEIPKIFLINQTEWDMTLDIFAIEIEEIEKLIKSFNQHLETKKEIELTIENNFTSYINFIINIFKIKTEDIYEDAA